MQQENKDRATSYITNVYKYVTQCKHNIKSKCPTPSMVGSSLSSGSLYNKVLIDVVGRFISGSGCFRRIFVPCHRSQYAFCQLTITLVRLQKKHYIDLITATCFFHGLLMIEQTVHHATISKAFQKMRSAFWPATKLKSKGIQNMKENYRKHTSYSSVFQSVVGHSAVFKWVIDLVQKYIGIQLSEF